MEYKDTHKRLEAAHALFVGSSTSREKVTHVRSLIKGIHKGIDEKLAKCDEAFSQLEKIGEGEYIELSAAHLPERTEEEKKRKKALLLFIRFWKDLQNEVERVQAELNNPPSGSSGSVWGKIFSVLKGPFGIITVVAVGGALLLNATSVRVVIKNNGCGAMIPGSLSVSLPGLSLPKEPIKNGESGVATLPPLTVSIDGTMPGSVRLHALKMDVSFQVPSNIDDVTFNGESILYKKTTLKLGDRDEHEVMFTCS